MSNQDVYEIRAFEPNDLSFIMATFLRGLYYGDSWFSVIPKQVFMDNYKLVAQALINSPKNTVQIACLKEDRDVILGYSILSSDFEIIHWVFVKKAFRKQGISKRLLPQYPTAVTHLSDLGKTLLPKFKNCIFNPFAL